MQEIEKQKMIILVRNDIHFFIDKDQVGFIQEKIEKGGFIKKDGNLINTKDIIGVFEPSILEDMNRRKNGQWKDKKGVWRNKGDKECSGCGNVIPYGRQCGYCYSR